MANDPVCGMEVNEATASKTEHKGETYYFCCEPCKDTFEKDPGKYAKKKAGKRGCCGR